MQLINTLQLWSCFETICIVKNSIQINLINLFKIYINWKWTPVLYNIYMLMTWCFCALQAQVLFFKAQCIFIFVCICPILFPVSRKFQTYGPLWSSESTVEWSMHERERMCLMASDRSSKGPVLKIQNLPSQAHSRPADSQPSGRQTKAKTLFMNQQASCGPPSQELVSSRGKIFCCLA